MQVKIRVNVMLGIACCALLIIACGGQSVQNNMNKPNVILVMTDDQGYGDLSVHGNPVLKTPNLDQLYQETVHLTDFHVAPMCTPTRGQLLSGRDAMDNGATFVCQGRSMPREELPFMADIFGANGYRTGHFGKWHLGDSYPYRPQDRGFQETVHHGAWGISSIADHWGNDYFDDTFRHNDKLQSYEGYCTDVFFEEAMDWMKIRQDQDEPFFLYLPTNTPHVPNIVAEKYAAPYQGKGPALFYGMIANIDENMGKLDAFLKDTGLRENTILIFMTDNGTSQGHTVFNAGMRGHKRDYYDGGHRVPFFIRWPAGNITEPFDIDALTHCQDVLPTLIDLCELQSPANVEFDGVSLTGLIRKDGSQLDDRMLFVQYEAYPEQGAGTVLWNKWRLVKNTELYNIADDPGQQNDVAAQNPDIVRQMRDGYNKWWAESRQGFETLRNIHIGNPAANPMILYSSDWQGDYADNPGNLLKGDAIGAWDIIVDQPGRYEFSLYRWAPESDKLLTEPASILTRSGGALPIAGARLKIGNYDASKPTEGNDESVRFVVDLPAGKATLETWFTDAEGKPLCSAFYTHVRLK